MKQPFERVRIKIEHGTNRLIGSGDTFGCSCCSDTKDIEPGDLIAKLRETQEMYEQLAASHKQMADALVTLGEHKVGRALVKIKRAEEAWSLYDQATLALDKKGGTWGDELLEKYGIDYLKAAFEKARARITSEDLEIARLAGWNYIKFLCSPLPEPEFGAEEDFELALEA